VLQRKLHAGQGAKNLEVTQPAQVTDSEHLAFELAQADSESEIQALRSDLDDAV
jgi:hypothetical protein